MLHFFQPLSQQAHTDRTQSSGERKLHNTCTWLFNFILITTAVFCHLYLCDEPPQNPGASGCPAQIHSCLGSHHAQVRSHHRTKIIAGNNLNYTGATKHRVRTCCPTQTLQNYEQLFLLLGLLGQWIYEFPQVILASLILHFCTFYPAEVSLMCGRVIFFSWWQNNPTA